MPIAGTLFGAGLMLSAAYGLGSLCTRGIASTWPVRLCAGAACFSLIMFALMTAHLASPPVVGGVASVCSLLLLTQLRGLRFGRAVRAATETDRTSWWVLITFVPFFIFALVNAMAPEVEADPNIYHLQAAMDAQRLHGFSQSIGFYERLPQAMELLYVLPFNLGGAPAAKLLHFAFLLSTLPLIVRIGRRFDCPGPVCYGAAFLYFASPVVSTAGASAFNDSALVFATCAVMTVLFDDGPAWLAGFLAGFCWSIKITGGVAILVGLGYLLLQRRFRPAVMFLGGAFILTSPWILRNVVQTGNPFAPFLNRWFPNPYFHPSTEERLGADLRSYGISFWRRFPEVLWGWRLHGIIGPIFAFAPLAILGARRRSTAILLVLAAAFAFPWWLNAGARFLTLSLPFLALALLNVTPRGFFLPLVALHALTCWPLFIHVYSPRTWHLYAFPWRAAIGLESAAVYLNGTSEDYRAAKLIESHTVPTDLILDLQGIHAAHIRRELHGFWQSSVAENGFTALEFARIPSEEKLSLLKAPIARQPLRGIRIRQNATSGSMWSISEIELMLDRQRIRNGAAWSLEATPNRWETPFAFDANLASRWISWQPARKGQVVQLSFEGTETADMIRVLGTRQDSGSRMEIDVQTASGDWVRVDALSSEYGALDLRSEAMRFVRKLGFTHIVAKAGREGIGQLGFSLANEAEYWGVEVVDNLGPIYLLKIR